jgi:uncharacterized membrane protein YoaT (DUF817 family)
MDKKFNTLLSICIIPQILDLIVQNEKVDDIAAIDLFYNSKTYEFLSKEDTKFWHYSPLMLYTIWKYEKETGELYFPEEAC